MPHRPYSLVGSGKAAVQLFAAAFGKYRGRAGRQGSYSDPRASMPRDIEAPSMVAGVSLLVRSEASRPQVRQTQGVPRAMFIGLLRFAPGGRTISGDPASSKIGRPLIHRSGPRWRLRKSDHAGNQRQGGPATHSGAPGRSGLDRRSGEFCAPHLRRPRPATAPHPASGDADQTPLGLGWDRNIIVIIGYKSTRTCKKSWSHW